jgi:hypothetical protein
MNDQEIIEEIDTIEKIIEEKKDKKKKTTLSKSKDKDKEIDI